MKNIIVLIVCFCAISVYATQPKFNGLYTFESKTGASYIRFYADGVVVMASTQGVGEVEIVKKGGKI